MHNKNLLFIMCDDLNTAIGPYKGHPQTITPNIDRLAAQATVFENGYCNSPLCGPSRASLFSGLYPHTSEKFAFGSWEKNAVLSSCTIMQEQFRNHGFQVWGTGKLFHNGNEDDRDLMPDEENAQWAAEKLRNAGDEPFSLFVGFNRPHTPLYAPEKYFDKFPTEDTMGVFTSDNGYHLGQKGMTFKCTLYEESCRIPLIIREGGQTEPRRLQQRASLVDLYPTFNEVFGMDTEPNKDRVAPALEGASLMPLLSADGRDDEIGDNIASIPTTTMAVERYGPEIGPAHFTLHLEGVKYNLYGNGEEEFFDLEKDPLELRNLANDPEWLAKKGEMKKQLLARTPDWFLNVHPDDWERRKWDLR